MKKEMSGYLICRKLSLDIFLSTLVLTRYLQNQFQLVYSQQQTPIANSSNYFPKNEISNVMLEQFKEIVFNQSSSKSSNNDVMTNSSIPIVKGLPEALCKGPKGTKKYASAIIAAVPDRKLEHHDILVEGDKVLIRWTNSGTNTGPLFGNSPTGNTYIVTGFDLFRISDGKIKELWQQYNLSSW